MGQINEYAAPSLTRSELKVLSHLAQGYTTTEIARMLNNSPYTIQTHVARIILKMHARRATHAIALAAHYRIINPVQPLPN